MRLRHKLTLANLLFKLVFVAIFIAAMPYMSQRINLIQTDNELIEKREMVIDLIAELGTEPFIADHAEDVFGSYNILKEEYISLEQIDLNEHWNFIEVTERIIGNEIIEYRVLNYSFLIDGETYLLEIGKSLSSISATEQNIRRVTLLFLVIFVIISVLFELLYTTSLLQPFSAIYKKLKKTSNPALFDKTPVNTTTKDFKDLDNTLSSLMEKMEALFKKEKEITQNISHELLTPVSILRSKLENLLLNESMNEEALTKTEEALVSLHRLKSMVNSLLLIARVESSQYLKQDSFSLGEILQEVVSELKPLAEDKEIQIIEEIETDYRFNAANRSLIFSMFFNVINNAIRFVGNNGTIKVTSIERTNIYEVYITDNGPGIPPELMPNLFSRFKKKKTTEDGNNGIGLAIAKSIADFHEIPIEVQSKPDDGTSFIFTMS